MIIKWIINTIAAINANNRPGEIAAAAALGVTLAMIPSANLTWVVLLAVTFFLKIHFGMELIIIAILKPFAVLLDPLFDIAGYSLLTMDSLEPLFTKMYNMPVVPFTGFNNTVTAGSIIVMAVMFYPVFLLFSILIRLYREKVRDRLLSSPVIKKIAALPLISKIVIIFKKAMQLKNY